MLKKTAKFYLALPALVVAMLAALPLSLLSARAADEHNMGSHGELPETQTQDREFTDLGEYTVGEYQDLTDNNGVKWKIVNNPSQFVAALSDESVANIKLGADIFIPGSGGISTYNKTTGKTTVCSTTLAKLKNAGTTEMIIDGRDPVTGVPHTLNFLGDHRLGLGNIRLDANRPSKITLRNIIAEGRDELGIIHAYGTTATPTTIIFDNCKLKVCALADMEGYDSQLIIKDCHIELAYRIGEGSSAADAAKNSREWSLRDEFKTVQRASGLITSDVHASEAGAARLIELQGTVNIWKADSPGKYENDAIWHLWYDTPPKYPTIFTVAPNAKVSIYDYSESPDPWAYESNGGTPTGLWSTDGFTKPHVKIGKSASFQYRHMAGKDGRHGNGVITKELTNLASNQLAGFEIDDGATVIFDVMASRSGKWTRNNGAYMAVKASDNNTGLFKIGENATFIFTLDYRLANAAKKTRTDNKLFTAARLEIGKGANVVVAAKNNDGAMVDKTSQKGTSYLLEVTSASGENYPHSLILNNPRNALFTNGTNGAAVRKSGNHTMPLEIHAAGMGLWKFGIPQGLVFNTEDALWEIDENHPSTTAYGKGRDGTIKPPSPIEFIGNVNHNSGAKDNAVSASGSSSYNNFFKETEKGDALLGNWSTWWLGQLANLPVTVTINYYKGDKVKNPADEVVVLKVRSTEQYLYQLVNLFDDGEEKYDLDIAGIKGALPACDDNTASNCMTIDREIGSITINKPEADVVQNVFSNKVTGETKITLHFYKFSDGEWMKDDSKTKQTDSLSGASGAKTIAYPILDDIFGADYEFDYVSTVEKNHGNAIAYGAAEDQKITLTFNENTRSPVKLYYAPKDGE